ncbi:MAG: hypothetical protein KAX36_03040 [Thermoflexales bacterium]|nr:hypothetical protein [Thermoflexales bacterium]
MPFKNPHPLYQTWQGMRSRCRNPKYRQWNDYGGRGIDVCKRWDDFQTFAADMGERPPGHSIDRIDNDKDYSPENCRWATRKEQQRNQRRAVFVEVDGVRYRAIELADKAGVKVDTVISRSQRGLPYDEVVSRERSRGVTGLALGGLANGARQKSKTHCPHGHSYEDAMVSARGARKCRTCHRDRARAARAAR